MSVMFPNGQDPATGAGLPDPASIYDLSFAPAALRLELEGWPFTDNLVDITDEQLTAATETFFGASEHRHDVEHLYNVVSEARMTILRIAGWVSE